MQTSNSFSEWTDSQRYSVGINPKYDNAEESVDEVLWLGGRWHNSEDVGFTVEMLWFRFQVRSLSGG